MLRKRDGSVARLLDKNVAAVHQLGPMTLALVGLAHLTMNDGVVYRYGDGKAVAWRRLPGAPRRSGFLPDGRLFVECEGGEVAIGPDGKLGGR